MAGVVSRESYFEAGLEVKVERHGHERDARASERFDCSGQILDLTISSVAPE